MRNHGTVANDMTLATAVHAEVVLATVFSLLLGKASTGIGSGRGTGTVFALGRRVVRFGRRFRVVVPILLEVVNAHSPGDEIFEFRWPLFSGEFELHGILEARVKSANESGLGPIDATCKTTEFSAILGDRVGLLESLELFGDDEIGDTECYFKLLGEKCEVSHVRRQTGLADQGLCPREGVSFEIGDGVHDLGSLIGERGRSCFERETGLEYEIVELRGIPTVEGLGVSRFDLVVLGSSVRITTFYFVEASSEFVKTSICLGVIGGGSSSGGHVVTRETEGDATNCQESY